MNLHLVSETATTITLGWDPVQGAVGYRFTSEKQAKPSHTWDPTRSTVRFAKGSAWYKVEALESPQSGIYPPPVTGVIPAFEVTLSPNWVSSQDGPNAPTINYNAIWAYPKSPTTPYRSPDSLKQVSRYMLLDPRYKDANGLAGQDEWWFLIERYWPASFDPYQHGSWGRKANFHNVAGDAGSAENSNGGVGWGFGSGVSALALDWLSGSTAPSVAVLSAYQSEGGFNQPLPAPSRDEWHSYLIRWVAGRTDGTTVRPGAVTIWADGQKVIEKQNLNTVQKAKGNVDGKYYVQRWIALWEGDYTQNLPAKSTERFALTRIGTTLDGCVADRPVKLSDNVASQYYRGTGTNLGAPSLTSLEPRQPNDARIPLL